MINIFRRNMPNNYGWRDITASPEVRITGAGRPTWSQIGATPFNAYKFTPNDGVWFCYHIPHDIVTSYPIHLHVHWLPDGTDTQPVKWRFQYAYALGFNQEDFPLASSTEIFATSPTLNGTAYRHYVTETDAITIPTLTEPDGLLYVYIDRVTNGGTDNANGIFMLTSDVHYFSNSSATPGKAPDFYI